MPHRPSEQTQKEIVLMLLQTVIVPLFLIQHATELGLEVGVET